jgi:hypothetical protein
MLKLDITSVFIANEVVRKSIKTIMEQLFIGCTHGKSEESVELLNEEKMTHGKERHGF